MRVGSSPRPRGTHGRRRQHHQPRRLIPAPAGNTILWGLGDAPHAAHPRARGEHIGAVFRGRPCHGSSPRPRGTPHQPTHEHGARRLIPAPAGNTVAAASQLATKAAHPRARGEHGYSQIVANYVGGSSPRPRGTQRNIRSVAGLHRLIPAPAGNTPCHLALPLGGPAHPRARGEHGRNTAVPRLSSGSSPRPRGTPLPCCKGRRRLRLIPAPAGNTAYTATA